MGSYGIGPGRLVGAIVEVLADEKGLVWGDEVAPFAVHLIGITSGNADVVEEAERLYALLEDNDIEVLFDDRDVRAGEKFADADLLGMPRRLIVSEKTMSEGGAELVMRVGGAPTLIRDSDLIEKLSGEARSRARV